jgi:uncharacterized protein YkwD
MFLKKCLPALFLMVCIACSSKTGVASASTATVAVTDDEDYEKLQQDILSLINTYRKKKGKPPLASNDDIAREAAKHSTGMAKGSVPFGHTGFNERSSRLLKKISGMNASAENVAYGYESAEEVVNGWINSAGHRKNIEGNYNLTGIGIAKAKNGQIYYTQIFVNKP